MQAIGGVMVLVGTAMVGDFFDNMALLLIGGGITVILDALHCHSTVNTGAHNSPFFDDGEHRA